MFVKVLILIFIILNPFVLSNKLLKESENNPAFAVSSGGTGGSETKTAKLPLSALSLENIQPGLANLMSSLAVSAGQEANPDFLPIRNWSVEEPNIEAAAALILDGQKEKILYQKNIDKVLPIASLTKLMTALIVLENNNPDQIVIVSKKAVEAYGETGGFKVSENISIRTLLYVMLMTSSNDAATALADGFQLPASSSFVDLMNKKAKETGLENTRFTDPTGYEPTNVSTALDLAKLTKYALNQPLIWQILKTGTIDLQSSDGLVNHHLVNNNLLLNRLPNVVGGKTGYTEEAGDCMILVIQNRPGNYLIFIILGSKDRFLETERLVEWAEKAYLW